MKKLSHILLAITLFALSGIASAVQISGDIIFSGSYTINTAALADATVFTFNNPTDVDSATGSFAPLSGSTVTYDVLDLNNLPASPLWSSGIYSFDLNTITLDGMLGSARVIQGTGIFTVGSDTAFGIWNFSTQEPGADGTFSFSAAQAPGPAPFILMGLGLIGIGVTRKLRKV